MEALALILLVCGSLGLGVVLARATLARILSAARMIRRQPDDGGLGSERVGLVSPPTRRS